MYQSFIIPYLYEAQHVSDDTPPIIRSLRLHWQPLAFHTWKVVGRVVVGRCQEHTVPDTVHQLHVQQPSTYEKPESASAVGRVVGGRCQAHTVPDDVHQLHVQTSSTYEKPEAASAVLGS